MRPAAGGFSTEHARAELRHVQIDLEDPGLGPKSLDPQGQPSLEPLSEEASAGPQVQILRDLLGDRARPSEAAFVFRQGLADRCDIEPPVDGELLVFGGHDRDRELGRDPLEIPPLLRHRPPLAPGRSQHERAGRRIDPSPREDEDQRREEAIPDTAQGPAGEPATPGARPFRAAPRAALPGALSGLPPGRHPRILAT